MDERKTPPDKVEDSRADKGPPPPDYNRANFGREVVGFLQGKPKTELNNDESSPKES